MKTSNVFKFGEKKLQKALVVVGLLGLLFGSVVSYSHAQSKNANVSPQIYVTDSGNNRIVRMDDMTGKNWTH